MERRARRWRLPLAARIGALPALVAVAAALAFGFSQSDAAQANRVLTGYRLPDFNGANLNDLPPGNDLPVSFGIGFPCSGSTCRVPTGTIQVLLRKEDGNFGYWQGEATLTGQWTYESQSPPIAVVRTNTISIPGGKLQPGRYRIHHYYPGDEFFERAEQDQKVDPLLIVSSTFTSHFSMSTTPNPSKAGEPITLSASYDGAYVGAVPSGRVFFYLNGNYFTGANLKDGKASYNTKNSGKAIPLGQSTWTVRYNGDSKFRPFESPGWTHTVEKKSIETTIEVSVAKSTIDAGTDAHFKVKVAAKTGTAVPTGQWEVFLGDGSSFFGQVKDNGEWEGDAPVGPPGEHTVFARYTPTGDFAASESAPIKVTVVKTASTTTVSAAPEAAAPGKPVKLTATVAPPPAHAPAVDGRVRFTDGDVELGTCELNNTQCEITTDKLVLGKRTITAAYQGNRDLEPSQGTVAVRVSGPSATKLTVNPNPATAGTPVGLSAQVIGAAPATGKVTFLDGTTELGKSDVDKDGKATFSAGALSVGAHELTAKFEGSDTLDASASEKIAVQVNAAGTPGQGGVGGSSGGSNGSGGSSGGTPQPKNLASTGADIGAPLWGGAALVILGAIGVTLGRRRRSSR